MAERAISGTDVLLFIDPAGGTAYDTVICLTSNSFNAAVEKIDSRTKCGANTLPGSSTFEVSFEGQVMYDPAAGRISTADLYTLLANKTTVGWKIGTAIPASGDVIYEGTAFIANLDQTYADNTPSTFSGSLGIYGTPTQTVTV